MGGRDIRIDLLNDVRLFVCYEFTQILEENK